MDESGRRWPAQGDARRSRHRRLDRDLCPGGGRGQRPFPMVDAGPAALDPLYRARAKDDRAWRRPGQRREQGRSLGAMTGTASKQPGSAYPLEKREERAETHTMTGLVDNEPGVLARVIGLFSGRGYNIESLTVSETEHEAHLSRITIVTTGTPMVIEQIQHQLERLVPVHSVTDLTVKGNPIERELAMVKVAGKAAKRVEALRLADAFRAQVIDATTEHFWS